MTIKYNDSRYIFNKEKKLNEDKKQTLLELAEEYIKCYGIINPKKFNNITSKFGTNSWTIIVEARQKILGFKRTKTYNFNLQENRVELVVPSKTATNAYIVKELISSSDFGHRSFLDFVSTKTSHPEDYNIKFEEREYDLYPGAIS